MREGAEDDPLLPKSHPDPGAGDRQHYDLLRMSTDHHANFPSSSEFQGIQKEAVQHLQP
jgi:hypothetical protein